MIVPDGCGVTSGIRGVSQWSVVRRTVSFRSEVLVGTSPRSVHCKAIERRGTCPHVAGAQHIRFRPDLFRAKPGARPPRRNNAHRNVDKRHVDPCGTFRCGQAHESAWPGRARHPVSANRLVWHCVFPVRAAGDYRLTNARMVCLRQPVAISVPPVSGQVACGVQPARLQRLCDKRVLKRPQLVTRRYQCTSDCRQGVGVCHAASHPPHRAGGVWRGSSPAVPHSPEAGKFHRYMGTRNRCCASGIVRG